MLYRALRPLLFQLDPESAHAAALRGLDSLHAAGLGRMVWARPARLPVAAMGLEFPNPVGLAAGLDKNGDHIDALLGLGFGFVELGAVTPRPQAGNPRPRLFRLPQAQALINRMGFNNLGVDHLVERLRRRRASGIVGVNIGRNADTPNERAHEDYLECLRKVHPFADFVTANVSSPNTRDLRALQQGGALAALLAALATERDRLAAAQGRRVPLAIKIAPDLDDADIDALARRALDFGLDAVIATTTTVSRAGVEHLPASREAGGLSGAPLRARATAVVKRLAAALRGRIPVIGVGGVASAAHAREKLAAGATLVQLCTGLVYEGPGLVADIVRGLTREKAA
ncbi:MAG: quinone-dependent dihydroorotate dehydrogenase [Burkholderiales bacterium]|nr:quinone-dependent dihydroorotate dehydrogenase [Burkholderiales bacterium]